MRLKLSDLQHVLDQTLKEAEFCNEIKRVFGDNLSTKDNINSLCEQANYRLDVMERTGKVHTTQFSQKKALALREHSNPEVRRLIVRVLSESNCSKFLYDRDASVRYEAARKAPLVEVKNAARKLKDNLAIFEICRERQSSEAKEKKKTALEAAEADPDDKGLSEDWYRSAARKLLQDYGRTLDTSWYVPAIKQQVYSMRSLSRCKVDPQKLMKTLMDLVEEKEDEALESLEESYDFRNLQVDSNEGLVEALSRHSGSSQEYLKKADDVFNIKYSIVPPGIKKFALGEGRSVSTKIPVVGTLPHAKSFRRIDEVALDSYVKHWNSNQQLRGEPYKLSWSPHPDSINKVSFHLELK